MISTRLYCWSLGLVEFGFAGRGGGGERERRLTTAHTPEEGGGGVEGRES
jgi:hypothetical protein